VTDHLRTRIAAVVSERYRNDPTNDVEGWSANLADAVIRELETELPTVRLLAWARDCVLNGDMTPSAERVLGRILAGHND